MSARAESWARASGHGSRWAAAGGVLALVATALLLLHAGGGLGGWIAGGFGLAGIALAGASLALAARVAHDPPRAADARSRDRAGSLRSCAVVGAAGFVVAGVGLVADILEWPIVTSEIGAVAGIAAWWGALAWRLLERSLARRFAAFSALCAAAGLVAIALQLLWHDAPAGAVPVRFAYVLWGPWGLWLTPVLAGLERGGQLRSS